MQALHGTDTKTGKKVWAWHGLGEDQLHFCGEKDWWITQGSDCPFANLKMPDSDEKIDTETFLSCLDKFLK
ncbi:MAG: hypothetical protein LBB23_00355 [Rickettsiales bacterium]|nr:hypothetical protein [Rickettsiales bacterium]